MAIKPDEQLPFMDDMWTDIEYCLKQLDWPSPSLHVHTGDGFALVYKDANGQFNYMKHTESFEGNEVLDYLRGLLAEKENRNAKS